MKTTYLRLGLCALVATFLALTAHIYISESMQPFIENMVKEQLNPEAAAYPRHIIIAAYITALISRSIVVFVYYNVGHLLKVSNRVLKSLLVAVIILESTGSLFRQTIMDYLVYISMGAKMPFILAFFNCIDPLTSNIIFAFCLVYFCPLKHDETSKLAG